MPAFFGKQAKAVKLMDMRSMTGKPPRRHRGATVRDSARIGRVKRELYRKDRAWARDELKEAVEKIHEGFDPMDLEYPEYERRIASKYS